ncbi:MAG: hypothetical protein AMJ62_09875 [Myxococcales bacterium SG8_38]|nr:MAG: hypothetical protein AMJ62_09875 [Myxococcales bacterium SG8_38]
MTRPWTLLLVGIAGCSFSSSEMAMVIDNSCVDDTGCQQGVCSDRICIDDSGASVEVAIEVLRSSSDVWGLTPASWAFGAEQASSPTTRDLQLPATRQVRGTVRWNDLRIPATLRFVRRMADSVQSLTPVAVEAQTLREEAGADELTRFDFSAILVAQETYDVVVLPSTDMVMAATGEASAPALRSLPPLYLELVIDDGDPGEPFRFDIEFPSDLASPCTTSEDTGCTLEAEVLSVDGLTELPEAGLQVRAIEMETGRIVSSIGETDETGRVSIRISDTAADYWIRITSSVGRAPFPAVSVDPDVVFDSQSETRFIYIPRLPPVRYTGTVRDANDAAVPGATLRFLSTGIFGGSQLGLEGSFSGSATTNEDGTFSVELLPGYYSISVTPPADVENNWGVLTTEALLVGEQLTAAEAFIVPPQIGLQGLVTTFRDEAASGVTIVARARSHADSIAMHRSQEVVSNSIGAFAMTVDEGIYDLQVRVPSETGFAWLIEPNLAMSGDRGDLSRSYRLVPPIPVRGFLRASDGSPAAGALIRGYLSIDDGGGSRRIQIAETTSREDGSYELLIAPGLGE